MIHINQQYYSRTKESKDHWQTPRYFFKLLDDEFHFTLDAAASDENHLCDKYYTIEQDGLKQDWHGETVFINPPFSDLENWVKKAYLEFQKKEFNPFGKNTTIVMILPSRTDTQYWHDYIMKADEIRLVYGRVNFLIRCDNCKNSVSKTIFYKKNRLRLCKACYSRITGNKSKTGSGATFPLAIVIFKSRNPYVLHRLKVSSFEHKKYKNHHNGPTLKEFIQEVRI